MRGPAIHYGCALAPDGLCVLLARRKRGAWEVLELRGAPLRPALFRQPPSPEQTQALASALSTALPEARNRLVPLHFALPDPLGLIRCWSLPALPPQKEMQQALLRLRFAEIEVREDRYVLQGQVLSRRPQAMFLGQAIEASWLQCVRDAASAAGLAPWAINLAGCYRYNSLFERAAHTTPGAVLSVEPGSWSLGAWDDSGRYRYQRARWRLQEDEEAEVGAIADEVVRLLVALEYATQLGIPRLHLLGDVERLRPLQVQLEARAVPGSILVTDLPGLSPLMVQQAPLAASAYAAIAA